VLRYGALYGPDAIDGWMSLVRKRMFPIVGGGTGWMSLVHVDDAVAATALAVERKAAGVFNIVDDEPAPARDWLPVLADALGAPVSPCRHRAGRLAARRQQRPGTRPRLDAAVPVLANRLRRDEDNLTAPWVPLLHPPPHPGSGERADEPVQVGVRLPPAQSEARRAQPVQDRVRHHESRPKGLVLRRSGTCQTGTQ
jgi:hypothetical protein